VILFVICIPFYRQYCITILQYFNFFVNKIKALVIKTTRALLLTPLLAC
jgi:hypothetical protein